MTLPDLFDPPSRHDEPTSKEAAQAIRSEARTIRAAVLSAVYASRHGLIGSEVVTIVGRDPWVVRPRLTELKDAGYIIKTYQTRPGPSGRPECVWLTCSAPQRGT